MEEIEQINTDTAQTVLEQVLNAQNSESKEESGKKKLICFVVTDPVTGQKQLVQAMMTEEQ